MGRRRRCLSAGSFVDDAEEDGAELEWPFGRLDELGRDELRATAYEIFFTACRSSPGFGGRSPAYHNPSETTATGAAAGDAAGRPSSGGGANMAVSSRIKRALGLRTRRAAHMRPMTHLGSPAMSPAMSSLGGGGGAMGGAGSSAGKVKQRPMTSAEIMRQQMGVTELRETRLRKTLVRTLVGQAGKRAEAIILPLELLRHLKPSEFNDPQEYHVWQRRQLKVLEAGLILHPSIPLDRMNTAAARFSEIVSASELRPIDTSKNSETMRTLCNCVMALAWRTHIGPPVEVCHWADGFPLNEYLYLALLRSIFDLRDETVVLDEVDELLELMKKTWSILGINRMIHNVCFTWVLFEQYIATGQVEPDLIAAALAMLVEVANDARRPDREPRYVRALSAALATMQGWAEKRLLEYHDWFDKVTIGMMENVLRLALSTAKIISEDSSIAGGAGVFAEFGTPASTKFSLVNRVEHYIRTSMKSTFTKIFENENGKIDSMVVEVDEDPNDTLVNLAKETEKLAMFEKENYSHILKRWHPVPTVVAAVTLHHCFGIVLKQHLERVTGLTNELVRVLHTAGKLEKKLVQMAVEDSADAEDGGKRIMGEMISFEVDSVILNLMKNWIDERLRMGRECVFRAKETETWNPKSKSEPYAQSAVDLMKLAKVTVDEFFEIQVSGRDELVQKLADGLDSLFQDYISFVASCGSKQSYIPALPQLTRCNQDSMVLQLWKKAATPCKAGIDPGLLHAPCKAGIDRRSFHPVRMPGGAGDITNHPRPTASRGTQRLYVRLNTLHYLLGVLHSIDKSLSFFSRPGPSPSPRTPMLSRRRAAGPTHFDLARSTVHAAILHVAEVAANRLIFLDSSQSFYDSLYVGSVAEARIRPTLRILKQNLSLLVSVLTDRAQPLAVKEIMKASFEAFLMVLLAGGSGRAFARTDHDMIAEDIANLKRVFCTSGEGLLSEEVVQKEAAVSDGVVSLMCLPTEKLVEEFSIMACEASGLGRSMERVPMPPTSGRWHRSDPNTVLRVLCHRNDDVANRFLKRAFDLPKRR
ncbi:protein unc-13 homolog [Musa acuminata AAA Group]|uniref:protein unc-13 homolog n=1 Tax=Musa acuminata AAA Group TaxID=214697 RepID=UPI0031D4881A